MSALEHERSVAKRFDALESRFKAEVPCDDLRLSAVRSLLPPLSGLRVLDLGCGKGRFARTLVRSGASVVGIDASQQMLDRASGFDRVRGSALALPFAAGSFDAVLAIEVFEHLPSVEPTLAEIERVLIAGGSIIIIDKNIFSLNAKRPWLPNVLINRIDRARGLSMYPAGHRVTERWFGPGWLNRRLGRRFLDSGYEFLLWPDEASWRIFRGCSWARRMVVWRARKPAAGRARA